MTVARAISDNRTLVIIATETAGVVRRELGWAESKERRRVSMLRGLPGPQELIYSSAMSFPASA